MSDQLPEKVRKYRDRLEEPSNRRDIDCLCYCGEKMWYLGVSYHVVTVATILHTDEDGEPVYGDKKERAPYAHWRCINGHEETDGY